MFEAEVTLTAKGHPNIRATHRSTFEVTAEPTLTIRGDCIVGVKASATPSQVDAAVGWLLRRPGSRVTTRLSCGEFAEEVHGYGAPGLLLTSPLSLVWRTSSHIDGRTIAIRCDKAARDMNRQLIRRLQDPQATLHIAILVSAPATCRSKAT